MPFARDWSIHNFVMPLIMDSSNLGKFQGVSAGDIVLARKFARIPKNGVNIDCLDNDIVGDVLLVSEAVKNAKGETIDLKVEIMRHVACATEGTGVTTFRLDGNSVIQCRKDSKSRQQSFLELFSGSDGAPFVSCAIKPDGDMIRRHILGNKCLEGCERGWLRSQDRLDANMPEGMKLSDFPPVPRFRPLCPVCIGSELVGKQIKLRVAIDGSNPDDAYVHVAWEPFQRAVKGRRRALGYSGMCTCAICLVPSSSHPHPRSHAEAERMVYELAEYNMTTTVKDTPAAESAIAALPRMKYAEANTDATQCTVCQNGFAQHTTVAQLPCKHMICADDCIDWLRHQNSCPVCRGKIKAAKVAAWTPETARGTPIFQTHSHGQAFRDLDFSSDDDENDEDWPQGSEIWTEVRRMGHTDELRSRARRGSLDVDEMPMAPPGFYEHFDESLNHFPDFSNYSAEG